MAITLLIAGLAPSDGWDDGDIIPLFETGFQVLQETNIIPVYVHVDEAADLARLIADPVFDAGKVDLKVID
jgi:hypothetical protein